MAKKPYGPEMSKVRPSRSKPMTREVMPSTGSVKKAVKITATASTKGRPAKSTVSAGNMATKNSVKVTKPSQKPRVVSRNPKVTEKMKSTPKPKPKKTKVITEREILDVKNMTPAQKIAYLERSRRGM